MIENYNLFDISTPKQWKTIGSKNLKEDGEYPVYGANGIIGYYDKYNHEEETVFIGCRGTCGSVHLSEPFSYINGNAMAIDNVDNSKISNKYLFYFFKQYNFDNVITGTAIPQITRTNLKNVTIPIPDLPTQNKIVALLDKASALAQKREKSIALLDELLRAQFLEMFGRLAFKTQKYPIKKLQEFEVFITSGGRGWKKYYSDNGGRFIRSYDVQMNHISNEEIILVNPPDNQEAKRTRVEPNDILLTITGSKIGRVTIVPPDFGLGYVSQHVAIIRVKNINPLYLSYFLSNHSNGQYLVLNKQYGQTKPGLNFKQIRDFDITLPPLEIQNQFETIYHKIQAQKETLSQSKTELEHLFNSLLQRAFSGQLNFNVDVELDVLLAAIDIEQDTEKEKHNIKEIATVYAGRLLERIEEQNFDNQTQYQQAKQVVFQMLEEGIVEQAYDEKAEAVKLKLV